MYKRLNTSFLLIALAVMGGCVGSEAELSDEDFGANEEALSILTTRGHLRRW